MDSTLKSSLLLASILMVFTLSSCDNSKDKEECAESLVGLATCLPYVGGTAKAPTPDCCNGLKQLLKTNKKCLCVVIKDRNDPDLGLNLNVTLALGLPHVCNAPANISQCPALLNMDPNSPDAQVFYQLEKNGSSTIAGSPAAGGPTKSVVPNPTSPPASAGAGAGAGAAVSPQKSGGCGKAKSNGLLIGAGILLAGLLLKSTLFV